MRSKPAKIFLWGVFTISLVITLLNIAGYLSQTPYPGLLLSKDGNRVLQIFDKDQIDTFKPDDQLISINGISISDHQDSLTLGFWQDLSPGDPVRINLLRDGEQIEVIWTFSGQTKAEFRYRFFSPMWVALILWGCGASAYLTIRPADHNSALFLVFCCLTAIWLGSHYGPAEHNLWYNPFLERISAWAFAPLIFSFHWQFPNQLRGELDGKAHLPIIISGYLVSASFLIYDLFHLAYNLYIYGFLAGLLFGVGLIVYRFITHRSTRNHHRNIYISALVCYAILGLTTFHEILNFYLPPPLIGILFLLILPFPIIVLYTIWDRKIPKYQFRANRYLAGLIYSLLVLLGLLMLLTILENLDQPPNNTGSVLIALLIAALTTQTYPHFEKLVDWYIFKIPISSRDLLQSFSKQLDSTKDTASISSLMGELILPSLMVRQSVLIELQSNNRMRVLDFRGVLQSQIPDLDLIFKLLALDLKVIPPQTIRSYKKENRWIRVVLPLIFDNQVIGIWLLGQRDPNDIYDGYVVDLLQALAQQTTIALIHHRKSQRLRTLYKANIDRDEEERAKLARDLHDDTLNDLALLQRETKDPVLSDGIDKVIHSLRKTINGLRPEMLSYGLGTALNDLGDALNERQSRTEVVVQVDDAPIPIATNIEQHLYRIVQQACENALRHAQATQIRIIGIITEKAIHITVADNGIGFNVESTLDFSDLIAKQHFGLAGMHERADLIDARLSIVSDNSEGTRISVYWKNPKIK
jgi:signal transduction histidine kinase